MPIARLAPLRAAAPALAGLAAAALALLALPAAAAQANGGTSRSGTQPRPATQYYLSLGDSLSVGVQPGPASDPGRRRLSANTDEGYADQLYAKAKRRLFPGLRLIKAGCGGATTNSFINGGPGVIGVPGCTPPRDPGYRGTSPATSQLRYAERFLRRHRGRVAFVTLDIGNNNFTACDAGGEIDLACVSQGLQTLDQQLPTIARRVRRAAGPRTLIIGATLYNPFFAVWLQGQQQFAETLQPLTRQVNEDVSEVYTRYRIRVAPIDRAFRSYTPFSQTQGLQGEDQVPVTVATICNYTWYCTPPPAGPNIHANRTGYGVMADQFYSALRAGG